MERITSCRCCKKNELLLYLNLGRQPLANSYHKKENLLAEFPLQVLLCKKCFHSQLSIVVNPDLMFKNYLYVSGTTKTFQKHCEELAENAVRRFNKNGLSVLDIACNDGTQLECFRNLGCVVHGVDPAENLRKITKDKGIPVEVCYWSRNVAKKINKRFDIITGTNVFAHVNDLDEFLKAVKLVLKKNGLLILEFPYADKMIENNEFDTVYHEHLSYFLVNSFSTLIDRVGFHIVDVLQTQIHGGSIRFFVRRGRNKHSQKIQGLIENERRKGLLAEKTYFLFSKRVQKNKIQMKQLLSKLKKRGYKIIGYGASAKGNTMLNYFKINLSYIVDDNELKWKYFTPGRNIPIKNPYILKMEKQKSAIVILSWNFFSEIIKKIKDKKPNTDNDLAVMYVPTVKAIFVKNAENDYF